MPRGFATSSPGPASATSSPISTPDTAAEHVRVLVLVLVGVRRRGQCPRWDLVLDQGELPVGVLAAQDVARAEPREVRPPAVLRSDPLHIHRPFVLSDSSQFRKLACHPHRYALPQKGRPQSGRLVRPLPFSESVRGPLAFLRYKGSLVDLPSDHPRRPRLRVVSDRRRARRRRGGGRPEARDRRVPARSRATWACASSTSSRRTTMPTTSPGHGRLAAATGATIHIHRDARPTTTTSRSTTAGSSSSARVTRARDAHARAPPRAHGVRADRHRARAPSRGRCSPATRCSSATSPGPTSPSTRREGARGIFHSLHDKLLRAAGHLRGLARPPRRLAVRRARAWT